jgi:hypothetical protein
MNWYFTDTREQYVVELSNGALSTSAGRQVLGSDIQVLLERSALDEVLTGRSTFAKIMEAGRLEVTRGLEDFAWFLRLLDEDDPNFPIVTPRDPVLPPGTGQPPAEDAATDATADRVWHRACRLARPLLRGC